MRRNKTIRLEIRAWYNEKTTRIHLAGRSNDLSTEFIVGSEEAPVGAGLRPPLKRLVQFSRKPLSQRCLIEGSRKESERSGVQVRTRQ